MTKLVEAIAKSLVDNPDGVIVTETEGEQGTVIHLRVAPEALRTVVKAAATRNNKKVTVEIMKE